jgi:2-amino-4-hydroxy-6-hydroxymethyldihydropteridine diphosphokinase
VFLAFGSNLGRRLSNLESALAALASRGVEIRLRSSVYATEPVGGPPQGWYLNQVVGADTLLSPEALLEVCLGIEREFGRERGVRSGPRTLDVDILFHGDEQRRSERLTLPHPRLHERLFVLVPLAEIAPALVHPRLGATVSELLARCPDRSRVLLHAPALARK